jgi:probable rRNA maturation factor
MPDPPSRLRVGVVDGRGRAVRAPGLAGWLVRVSPRAARGELTVALVSDAHIRALNRTFRKKDATTDVLSFPAGSSVPGPKSSVRARFRGPRTPDRGPWIADLGPYLGDIVIARGVAARQARRAGHPLGTELRILALHGLLHLIGYDHEQDRGQMRRLEARLRRKGGLQAGLLERTR